MGSPAKIDGSTSVLLVTRRMLSIRKQLSGPKKVAGS